MSGERAPKQGGGQGRAKKKRRRGRGEIGCRRKGSRVPLSLSPQEAQLHCPGEGEKKGANCFFPPPPNLGRGTLAPSARSVFPFLFSGGRGTHAVASLDGESSRQVVTSVP